MCLEDPLIAAKLKSQLGLALTLQMLHNQHTAAAHRRPRLLPSPALATPAKPHACKPRSAASTA